MLFTDGKLKGSKSINAFEQTAFTTHITSPSTRGNLFHLVFSNLMYGSIEVSIYEWKNGKFSDKIQCIQIRYPS